MSISLNKPRWLGRGALALAAGAAFLASVTTPARAVMLPGSALFGYYDISEGGEPGIDFGTGVGDSILRLVNPSGNANISFGRIQDACAMIYVFDDDQEMGECCGCPLTPAQLLTFSFEDDLTSNWANANNDVGDGAIAIRASVPNAAGCESFSQPGTISPACNGGCDPTVGYNGIPTLLGSITHVQEIRLVKALQTAATTSIDVTDPSLTEVSLFDNGIGDTVNNAYLISQCAAIVGNGSGGGICTCPIDASLEAIR